MNTRKRCDVCVSNYYPIYLFNVQIRFRNGVHGEGDNESFCLSKLNEREVSRTK